MLRTGGGEAIQATLDPAHRDDVQVLGAAVVAAVHHRGDRQTKGHAVLVALGTGAPCVQQRSRRKPAGAKMTTRFVLKVRIRMAV